LELCLIEIGVDEFVLDGEEIFISAEFQYFGTVQKWLEDNGFEIKTFAFERIPVGELKAVTPEQKAELEKLIDKFEEDDDVQNVYHTMQ
jgi:transcriptional/translational regulatory protein YebC/TACO1